MTKVIEDASPRQVMRLKISDTHSLYIVNIQARANIKGHHNVFLWNEETVEYVFGDIPAKEVISTTISSSLGKIHNSSTAVNAGWGITHPSIEYNFGDKKFRLRARAHARDTDGFIEIINFTVHIHVEDL